ncbi:D-glycero-beta-D-manno-heptose 1-phosphate adenylyltransferase [Candidatus Zixiibacteriota bacterium]
MGRVVSTEELVRIRRQAREQGRKVVFTNGCFDLIHRGHVEYLSKAREMGDLLVVGLNTDRSVRQLKGPQRPLYPLEDRARVLAALEMVDYVCPFDEDTPARLIEAVVPDVLVKGGDYGLDQIVGRDTVEKAGGEVVSMPLTEGFSTRGLIEKIRERYG